MKASRFTAAQIVHVLLEWEAGALRADLTRRYGVTARTLYRWRTQYGPQLFASAKPLESVPDEGHRGMGQGKDQELLLGVMKDLMGRR